MDVRLPEWLGATGRVALTVAFLAFAALLPEAARAQQAAAEQSGITAYLGGSVLFTIQPLAAPSGSDPAWGLQGKAPTISGVFGVGRFVYHFGGGLQ